ncbi:meiotic recombination protein REC8 homolog isoform X2 [Trichomycterus rosablanca]|uniref:meiotic recombination protein REC8 homolog isoform X2 n=1 Tax=Trichomycterus rosablanca TaxID=2290929 RepID=UPI002F35875B
MFFYPTVLNHRTGCFATVWLAATKGRKMSRRDLLNVNVQRTCSDIMDYVLVQVPPPAPGLPRPRFSLYLSSQLQYGVILVYHRQCQLLLEEIQVAIDKLHRFHVQVQIDMLPQDIRLAHTIPDDLTLLTETEGARDPFFGLMEFDLSSPSRIIQLAQQMPEFSPEHPAHPPIDGITASQESITMAEQEPIAMPEPEFEGVELQDFDMVGMLLEQPDHFVEGEDQREPEAVQVRETERGREGEDTLERELERAVAEIERTRELTGSLISLDLAQTTDILSRELESVAEEDLMLPPKIPEPAERERTPEPIPIPPAPPSPERREQVRESPRLAELVPSSPEVPAPVQIRRRRRQLAFFDAETQISQDALQAQINDPQIGIKSLDDLIRAPSRVIAPQVLLNNPCMSLPPDILELWKQGAVLHHILPPERREEDRESARERERGREESEIGVLREMPTESESGILRHDTPVSSLVMEITDRDFSPLETPEFRRSPVRVSVSGLEDIPEERVPEMEEVSMAAVDSLRREAPADERVLTFHSLLPPAVDRRTVSQAFWRLLERVDRKEVAVRQDEPYGDIIISPIHRQPQQMETPVF